MGTPTSSAAVEADGIGVDELSTDHPGSDVTAGSSSARTSTCSPPPTVSLGFQTLLSSFFPTLNANIVLDVDGVTVLAEAAACHRAHPDNHVRLIGFDNYAQSKGAEMVIYRGTPV